MWFGRSGIGKKDDRRLESLRLMEVHQPYRVRRGRRDRELFDVFFFRKCLQIVHHTGKGRDARGGYTQFNRLQDVAGCAVSQVPRGSERQQPEVITDLFQRDRSRKLSGPIPVLSKLLDRRHQEGIDLQIGKRFILREDREPPACNPVAIEQIVTDSE